MGNPSDQLGCLLKAHSKHPLQKSSFPIDGTIGRAFPLTFHDIGFDSLSRNGRYPHLSEVWL